MRHIRRRFLGGRTQRRWRKIRVKIRLVEIVVDQTDPHIQQKVEAERVAIAQHRGDHAALRHQRAGQHQLLAQQRRHRRPQHLPRRAAVLERPQVQRAVHRHHEQRRLLARLHFDNRHAAPAQRQARQHPAPSPGVRIHAAIRAAERHKAAVRAVATDRAHLPVHCVFPIDLRPRAHAHSARRVAHPLVNWPQDGGLDDEQVRRLADLPHECLPVRWAGGCRHSHRGSCGGRAADNCDPWLALPRRLRRAVLQGQGVGAGSLPDRRLRRNRAHIHRPRPLRRSGTVAAAFGKGSLHRGGRKRR